MQGSLGSIPDQGTRSPLVPAKAVAETRCSDGLMEEVPSLARMVFEEKIFKLCLKDKKEGA